MIVTDHFVYIHVSRTGGTFLNKLIMQQIPGARMIQYHGQLRDLPPEYAHLPVIGFVRNPWDWYVSMFFDYKRKRQYVFQVLSDYGSLDFAAAVTRFLNLGDGSDRSRRSLNQLTKLAPTVINPSRQAPRHLPGLRSNQFANYPSNVGYYSWLFQLMFDSDKEHRILVGRFENLRDETLRLFEETGTPINDAINAYVKESRPLNSSQRPKSFIGEYSPTLEQLVAERDAYVVDRYQYRFREALESCD